MFLYIRNVEAAYELSIGKICDAEDNFWLESKKCRIRLFKNC